MRLRGRSTHRDAGQPEGVQSVGEVHVGEQLGHACVDGCPPLCVLRLALDLGVDDLRWRGLQRPSALARGHREGSARVSSHGKPRRAVAILGRSRGDLGAISDRRTCWRSVPDGM